MTPSELLVAAADRIRDLAAATSPGWDYEQFEQEFVLEADARWVAALSPAVAPMIEALFRQAAKEAADHEEQGTPMAEVGYCPLEESALALAKLICPELGVGSQ